MNIIEINSSRIELGVTWLLKYWTELSPFHAKLLDALICMRVDWCFGRLDLHEEVTAI